MDENLLDQLVQATGLPQAETKKIIKQWIVEAGQSPQNMSLEDFREVLSKLVQTLFVEVAEGSNQHISLSRSNAQR